MEIGTKNQKILENLWSASRFWWIHSYLAIALYRCDTRTAQEPASLFWCDAVMSLKFTHVRSFACRLTLRNLRAFCSTISRSCVTITRQWIFKGLLQVTIINAFFRMWLMTPDIFGRWCSVCWPQDIFGRWCSECETVNADNGKTRCFILYEKKEGVNLCNAYASTSFKNPL